MKLIIILFCISANVIASDLSVVSYNVYFNDNTGNIRYSQIIAHLNNTNIDIIALQEVTPRFYNLISKSSLAEKYIITPKVPEGKYFNLLLSKIKPSTSGMLSFRSNMGRAAVYADLQYNNIIIRIINVHLESLNSSISQALRIEQLKEVEKLFTSNTILLGDFNFSKEGSLYISGISNLIDAASASSQKNSPTYDIENNPIASSTADINEQSRRLDRFYISPNLKSSGYKVLEVFYSDHYPIIVNLNM